MQESSHCSNSNGPAEMWGTFLPPQLHRSNSLPYSKMSSRPPIAPSNESRKTSKASLEAQLDAQQRGLSLRMSILTSTLREIQKELLPLWAQLETVEGAIRDIENGKAKPVASVLGSVSGWPQATNACVEGSSSAGHSTSWLGHPPERIQGDPSLQDPAHHPDQYQRPGRNSVRFASNVGNARATSAQQCEFLRPSKRSRSMPDLALAIYDEKRGELDDVSTATWYAPPAAREQLRNNLGNGVPSVQDGTVGSCDATYIPEEEEPSQHFVVSDEILSFHAMSRKSNSLMPERHENLVAFASVPDTIAPAQSQASDLSDQFCSADRKKEPVTELKALHTSNEWNGAAPWT